MSDPDADVMDATQRALCSHGYASLTMQKIADETTLSKSALHYHYDSKRYLMLAFLDHLYEVYTDRLDRAEAGAETPDERLLALLAETAGRDDTSPDFRTALMEVKAQAPHDEGFRERLAEFDDLLNERLAAALREGREAGVVAESVDPVDAASVLVTLVAGTHTRYVAAGEPVDSTHERVREHVVRCLLTDEAEGGE